LTIGALLPEATIYPSFTQPLFYISKFRILVGGIAQARTLPPAKTSSICGDTRRRPLVMTATRRAACTQFGARNIVLIAYDCIASVTEALPGARFAGEPTPPPPARTGAMPGARSPNIILECSI
jgi:hypothetical protein